MSDLKTRPTTRSVRAFLAKVPDDTRRQDCLTVARLMEEATGAPPVMWGQTIVGFGRYRYRYESGREGEWMIVGFSPRKHDLTLYLMPGVERFPDLLAKLGPHRTGRSCLYLKRLADVDLKVLRRLIRDAVKAMANQRVDG